MDYKGKKIAITGAYGFIGHALQKRLHFEGAYVQILTGDVRDPMTFAELSYEYDYLFHFGAPSSQVLFKNDPQYCIETTLKGFMNASEVCKKFGIKLIYPSTGLLSMGEANEYARCKKICEEYAQNQDSIGIRIFATYGPGEGHKRDYASVPYLFARDMVRGYDPVVFGNGEQKRDFMYINDVIESILHIAEEANEKVIDVGSGEAHSFNDIIKAISKELGKPFEPQYIEKPGNYVDETLANPQALHKYYSPKTSFDRGIKNVVKYLRGPNEPSSV